MLVGFMACGTQSLRIHHITLYGIKELKVVVIFEKISIGSWISIEIEEFKMSPKSGASSLFSDHKKRHNCSKGLSKLECTCGPTCININVIQLFIHPKTLT